MEDGRRLSMRCFFRVIGLLFRDANIWEELEKNRANDRVENTLPNSVPRSEVLPKEEGKKLRL